MNFKDLRMHILVINSGSSSNKLALFNAERGELAQSQEPLWHTNIVWKNGKLDDDYQKEIEKQLKQMPIKVTEIELVGHRIVHGGNQFSKPVVINSKVRQEIDKLTSLAPLHIPQHLFDIDTIEKLIPNATQIAVFDTAFHSTISPEISTYPGPYAWKEQGIKRFGFHGISYEYCAARCAFLLQNKNLKFVCCHLGNGSSLAAIDGNKSIDTTMGFTPLEGLMMGSRCGSIDPGILLYLEQNNNQKPEKLFDDLYHSSGLLGISGESSDMRDIIRLSKENHDRAKLAFEMYIHSLRKNIGAMASVLDRFDVLIFTAGIGEHSATVRQAVCNGLKRFGVIIDEEKNNQFNQDKVISSGQSKVKIIVITTKEEWCIAWNILQMIKK